MPNYDIPTHPSVVKTNPHPGCYNRGDFKHGYTVVVKEVGPNGYTGRLMPQVITHTMSKECRQGVYGELEECIGCSAKKDTRYIEEMRKLT